MIPPRSALAALVLVLGACDTTADTTALPVTLAFDAAVETPPLDSVRARVLAYDEGLARPLTAVTLRGLDARTQTVEVAYDLAQALADHDYILHLETFFGGPEPFRKSFVSSVRDLADPAPVRLQVTEAVEVVAGRVTSPQEYRYDLFASDEDCEAFNATEGFLNCHQWVRLYPDGAAEAVWTDLVNTGTYRIEGDVLTLSLTTRWDGPPSARFRFAPDRQALRLDGTDRRWAHVPGNPYDPAPSP